MHNLTINYEWYNIFNSSYLLVHKTGCSTLLHNFGKTRLDDPIENSIRWTIIRNPMERFISGLAYDIRISNRTDFDSIIKYPEKLLFGEHHDFFRTPGQVSHTYMQSLYFLNEKIHMFVKLEDLKDFIKIHNGNYSSEDENKTNTKEKEIAQDIITKIGEQRINDLFYIENKIYNKIINSEHVWTWQYGNILQG